MADTKLAGAVVNNEDVASFIRKHGAPSYSKPHGAAKTILYYPDTEAQVEADAAEFEDHAGEHTPNAKTTIIQGRRTGSRVASVARSSHAAPHPSPLAGNPNDAIAEANILNPEAIDEEIANLEGEADRREAEGDAEVTISNPLARGPSLSEKVRRVHQDPVEKVPELPEDEEKKES